MLSSSRELSLRAFLEGQKSVISDVILNLCCRMALRLFVRSHLLESDTLQERKTGVLMESSAPSIA